MVGQPALLRKALLVGARGLEPPRIAPLAPKASVYTNFTTRPRRNVIPAPVRNDSPARSGYNISGGRSDSGRKAGIQKEK